MFCQKWYPILATTTKNVTKLIKTLTGQKQIKNVLLTKSTGCKKTWLQRKQKQKELKEEREEEEVKEQSLT